MPTNKRIVADALRGSGRELRSALENACLVAGGLPTLMPIHLPADIRIQLKREFLDRSNSRPMPPAWSLQSCTTPLPLAQHRRYTDEKKYLPDLLHYIKGHLDEACQKAGLSSSRLYALLRRNRIS